MILIPGMTEKLVMETQVVEGLNQFFTQIVVNAVDLRFIEGHIEFVL